MNQPKQQAPSWIEIAAGKKDKAGRRARAEQRHMEHQKAHAKEAVAGAVRAADFTSSQPREFAVSSMWDGDHAAYDLRDLTPIRVQEHVVDQTFRPCRHEGSMVYGPDQGAGEPENRAGWLEPPAKTESHDIGFAHRASPDLKGTVDFNHSLGHQPLADSAFGNLHLPEAPDSERVHITQPRSHGDDAPVRQRPDTCTMSFNNGTGRDEAVNVRAVDESGRVVVVEITKAIGRNTDLLPATECEAFSHLLAMQSEIPSSFKCTRPLSQASRGSSRTGRFRPLRKCVVR